MSRSPLLALLLTLPALAQPTPPSPTPGVVEIKPYDQVITAKAVTTKGVFWLHRVGDKLYYEIPKAQLDKDFLMVTQIARGKSGTGDGGAEVLDERVVRWHRVDNKIQLLDIDYSLWANPSLPVARAVEVANNPTILANFAVEAKGDTDTAVVEVSKFFLSDAVEISPKKALGATLFDKERSYLESAKAFPENIEVAATLTLSRTDNAGLLAWLRGEMPRGSASLRMRYSMVKLPEKPMMPRLRDSRVGYFATYQMDYGRPEHYAKERVYIDRWRLEKKDPSAELSEPIKPIVFYIDPATPRQWVPYIKAGVEEWQAAFEEAGFKKAIVAREAPTDDPDWSPEDARYSVIRWIASETANAYGPHTSDPRTGEILEADIHMFHNILDLQRRWYFTQVGHLDARAQNLPMPDELMGQLVQFVVAHEVGHSLGLPHNMRASSTYPLEKVRDPEWVKKMGHCPSIMDYSRFNYVAQPEDHIAVSDLIPKVGPYDRFSIRWGYRPVASATTPDAERETLDKWAREQDNVAWFRFSSLDSRGGDPGDQTEAVGDIDPVAATRLGLKNLHRVNDLLLNATAQYGEDYSEVRHFWRALLNQWSTEMRHLTPLVGGFHKQEKHVGQSGPIFTQIPKERQKAAVDFLLQECFQPQPWLADPKVVHLLHQERALEMVAAAQEGILYRTIDPNKLHRMAEQLTLDPQHAYSPSDFLSQMRRGIFSELDKAQSIPYPRRMVQRSLADLLIDLSYTWGEARGLGQAQLRLLRDDLQHHLKQFRDPDTQAHLQMILEDIQRELDPRGTGRKDQPLGSRWSDPALNDNRGCWEEPPEFRLQGKGAPQEAPSALPSGRL